DLNVGGYVRRFDWWSGFPKWIGPDGIDRLDHPHGYFRSFDAEYGAFYWEHDDSTEKIWDTATFWTGIE
ncbi:hypothetical protein JX266_014586, partial [Neoarthrinium moseri]